MTKQQRSAMMMLYCNIAGEIDEPTIHMLERAGLITQPHEFQIVLTEAGQIVGALLMELAERS